MVRTIVFFILILASQQATAQNYRVDSVPANLFGNTYSSAFFGNQLVVCSDQKDRIFKTIRDVHGAEPVDLYVLDKDSGNVERFDPLFRTKYNDGPIVFDKKAQKAIVSRNLKTDQKVRGLEKDDNFLGLYESELDGENWTVLKALPFNSPTYNCSHPAMNSKGDYLVFTSNMPGGHGGYDLWSSTFKEGFWTTPVNLGPEVNTSDNEVFPSLDGEFIYFSSDREGVGGLDIYYISETGKVKILDAPMNTEFDDFGLITNDNLNSGFLSSNRNGRDQIWKFYYEYPLFENCDPIVQDNFCYTLFEENAHEIGTDEPLIYRWKINEDVRYGVKIDYCFPEPGDYEITIDIIDTIIDVVYAEQDYFLMNISYEVQPYISAPDTVKPNEKFKLDPYKTNLPDLTILEHYWFFSDGPKYHTETTEHMYDSVGTYDVTLGVIGVGYYGDTIRDCTIKTIVCTTDEIEASKPLITSVQDMPDNAIIIEENLALKETDSVDVLHDILVFSSDERLEIPDTLFVDFTDVYPITEEYDSISKRYTYHIGKWTEISSAYPVWQELIEDNYPDAKLVSYEGDDAIQLNKSYELENLLFKTNKWDLSQTARESINELVIILIDEPTFRAIISAHTDNVGNDDDNMRLSESRAKSVSDYIQSKGIHPSRLSSKGYGETRPIATNETKEGRQMNRRVEFELKEK